MPKTMPACLCPFPLDFISFSPAFHLRPCDDGVHASSGVQTGALWGEYREAALRCGLFFFHCAMTSAHAPFHRCVLISDVVRLSGTYLILLIRIRLYLCRLDYIFYCTYRLGYPYCPSLLGHLIVLSLLFPLGTFLLFPMDYCLV